MACSNTNPRVCALPWCNCRSGVGASFSRISGAPAYRRELEKHESVDSDDFFSSLWFVEKGKEVRVCSAHCQGGVLLPLAQDPLWEKDNAKRGFCPATARCRLETRWSMASPSPTSGAVFRAAPAEVRSIIRSEKIAPRSTSCPNRRTRPFLHSSFMR